MNQTTSIRMLLLAAALCLFQIIVLSACGGCAARPDKTDAASEDRPPYAGGVRVQAAETALTPSAEMTAAYLQLLSSLSHGEEEAALQAAEILAAGRDELAMPAEHWMEFALWFMDRKSVNAIPFLRTACKADPDDPSLLLLYAESLTEFNFPREALAALDEYLSRHPGDTDILLQKGVTLQKDGRPMEAVQVFESISGKERTGFLEIYHAKALLALGRDREALPLARTAVSRLPDLPEALALLAFVCERVNELGEARQTYEKLLKLNPSSKDIILRLIFVSLKMKQPTKALSYYRQGPQDDVSFHLSAASLFTDSSHYLQAERILKNIAARPDPPLDVYLHLAILTYEQRRDLAAALRWLDKIPDDGDAAQRRLLLKAQLQAEDGKNEAALATVREGRASADLPDFVLLEARLLASLDRREEALSAAADGILKWPDSTELALMEGRLLSELGRNGEAMEIMEAVIARDDSCYLALNFVGYMLANEDRDIPRALELLNRANALAPGQYYILDSLAWAHYRAGNLNEAWTYICEAVRLATQAETELWEHYGDIAAARGQRKEARTAYRKAIDALGQNPAAGGDAAEALRHKMEGL